MTNSRCTKRRFMRVGILCQEFRHIAHRWKDFGQGSWMVPNLGQETVSEPSYGRSKSAISRFQKVRSDFVFPKFLAKNFYSILFLAFFYTRHLLDKVFFLRWSDQKKFISVISTRPYAAHFNLHWISICACNEKVNFGVLSYLRCYFYVIS